MNAVDRAKILNRYQQYAERFDRDAASRQRLGLTLVDSAESTQPGLPGGAQQLTPREQDVLELVAKGLTDTEIGSEARISEHTVKSHLKHVYWKLHAKNRAHAVALGVSTGLLQLAAA
jgi:DNA-binding NarL/FixJ family response regulator